MANVVVVRLPSVWLISTWFNLFAMQFKHLAEAIGAGLGSTFGSTVDRLMQGGGSSKRRR